MDGWIQVCMPAWLLLSGMLHGGPAKTSSTSDAKYALVAMRRTMLPGTAAMDAHNNSSCVACLLPAFSLASLLALLKVQHKQRSLRRVSGRFITNSSHTFKMRCAFRLFDVGSSSIHALRSSSMCCTTCAAATGREVADHRRQNTWHACVMS